MTQFVPAADESGRAAHAARGMLLVLALPCVAALALDPRAPASAALRILAEVAVLPGFLTVAGWRLASWIAEGRWAGLPRALGATALCICGAVLALYFLSPAPLGDWRSASPVAGTALLAIALPAVYAPISHALRGAPFACIALAVSAHVTGVIFAAPALTHFVFFVLGSRIAAVFERLEALAVDEREIAAASAPFVAALAAAVSIRFAQTGQTASLAALGPIALALGLAIGPAALATGLALQRTQLGDACTRLGRAGPVVAILWVPLFLLLITAASRGLAPTLTSAMLMALSSLLIVALGADAALDLVERRRSSGLVAQS